MRNRHVINALAIVACLALSHGAAPAALISPDSATASSSPSWNANMVPERLRDGSGLNALNQHSNSYNHMWQTNNNSSWDVWTKFFFNTPRDIDGFHVWNFNEPGGALNRGFRDVDVFTSTDGGSNWALQQQFTFAKAPGNGTYTGEAHSFASTVTGVDAVMFDMVTNHGASSGIMGGLSEVKFDIPPAPLSGPVVVNGQLLFNTLVTNNDQTAFTSSPITLTDPVSGESATIQITMTSLSGDQFLKLDGNTRLGVGNTGPDGYHVDIGNSNGDNNPLPEDVRFDVTLLGQSAGVGSVGFNITDLGMRDTGNPTVSWTSSVSTTPVVHASFTGEAARAMDAPDSFHALSASDYLGTLAPVVNQFQLTDINGGNGIQLSVQLNPVVIPEPLTMLAVGLSITGLAGYVRRRKRA